MLITSINSQILSNLPSEVLLIFKIFKENIRLVGGCVRDLLLNKKINDFDFACKFNPQQIQEKLSQNNVKSIPTGIKHGTITALINNFEFQITTLRTELNHSGRHCEVLFTDNFANDASRRDFTINALYLDSEGKIYDYFSGINDLNSKKVRFIGDPHERIKEDFLRILRFLRFSCHYSQDLDQDSLKVCIELKEFLATLSKERVREEFCKIINSPNYNQLFKILRLINDNHLDQILWRNVIDYNSFERVISFINYAPQKHIELIKILTLFVDNKFDEKIFYQSFKSTNQEKKFIKQYQEIRDQIVEKNFSKKINLLLINQMMIRYSKEILISFLIIIFAKNQDLSQENDLANIIIYIKKKCVPIFPLTASDLLSFGCPNNKINIVVTKLKIIWANSDFKINNKNLLKHTFKIINDSR